MVRPTPSDYDNKFADFLRLLAETLEDVVIVHHPQVLGDSYQELVESLNRLADAEKKLVIVPRARGVEKARPVSSDIICPHVELWNWPSGIPAA
jgi:hypothetical protein